jgi:hypothetical protein
MAEQTNDKAPKTKALSEPIMSYQAYLDERNAKLAIDQEQSKFIDGAILTLGGGALGLTLSFLHELSARPSSPLLAIIGSFLLVSSLLLALGSVYASQRSVARYISDLDDLCRGGFLPSQSIPDSRLINPWAGVTAWLNRLAGGCLIVGILLVSIFVMMNLPWQEVAASNGAKK